MIWFYEVKCAFEPTMLFTSPGLAEQWVERVKQRAPYRSPHIYKGLRAAHPELISQLRSELPG